MTGHLWRIPVRNPTMRLFSLCHLAHSLQGDNVLPIKAANIRRFKQQRRQLKRQTRDLRQIFDCFLLISYSKMIGVLKNENGFHQDAVACTEGKTHLSDYPSTEILSCTQCLETSDTNYPASMHMLNRCWTMLENIGPTCECWLSDIIKALVNISVHLKVYLFESLKI